MKYIAATDGSNKGGKKFGWAWVLVDETGKVIGSKYGCNLVDKTWAHGWNVAAECTAVVDLLRSVKPSIELEILHDYEGVGKWARGEWKAKSPCSVGYRNAILELKRNVRFTWVKGHSGHEMNELADKLASKALNEQPAEPVLTKVLQSAGE